MLQIITAKMNNYPMLEVEFSDGASRTYNVITLFPTYKPAQDLLANPTLAIHFRRSNRGGSIDWTDEIGIDAVNLRYFRNDTTVNEWLDVPTSVGYAERRAIAEKNLQNIRPTKVEIDLEKEVTPAEYARRKGLSIQTVQKQIKRGSVTVRRIPELRLTLVKI